MTSFVWLHFKSSCFTIVDLKWFKPCGLLSHQISNKNTTHVPCFMFHVSFRHHLDILNPPCCHRGWEPNPVTHFTEEPKVWWNRRGTWARLGKSPRWLDDWMKFYEIFMGRMRDIIMIGFNGAIIGNHVYMGRQILRTSFGKHSSNI